MNLDLAAEAFQFPCWDGEDTNVVGAMRASGFTTSLGAALIFEGIEYSLQESVIQCVAFCFANFPITTWGVPGEGVRLDVRSSDVDGPGLDFGKIEITSRDRSFVLDFDRHELVRQGYLARSEKLLSPVAVLFKICEIIPREWLFCEQSYLIRSFGLPKDAQKIFEKESWHHPVFSQLYGEEELKPSQFSDIQKMITSVCEGIE